ncbi:unnamed protein product [Ceutorhynchus assimilis]|uniref:Uncharacterized protein n=1 Tax=Ceutorhynchus assimilis TaxID=467358 RepID=A0A9N9MBE3_9CUCU|nr:unnamed protein product [Ceutorhynchus assimilis]
MQRLYYKNQIIKNINITFGDELIIIYNDNRKEAMFLRCAGVEVFEIYCSLPNPPPSQPPISSYKTAEQKLNTHFVPKISTEFEIFNFRQAKQMMSESIEEYNARLLKLSTNCNFNDKNKENKSQIIQCTTPSRLRNQNSSTYEPEDDDYASLFPQESQSSHDDEDDNAHEDPNTSLNEKHNENQKSTTSSTDVDIASNEMTADRRPQRNRKKPSHLEDYATDFNSD